MRYSSSTFAKTVFQHILFLNCSFFNAIFSFFNFNFRILVCFNCNFTRRFCKNNFVFCEFEIIFSNKFRKFVIFCQYIVKILIKFVIYFACWNFWREIFRVRNEFREKNLSSKVNVNWICVVKLSNENILYNIKFEFSVTFWRLRFLEIKHINNVFQMYWKEFRLFDRFCSM